MAFKVAQDAVDYGGIDDEGDDLHLGAASTEQRIRFVDAANQLRPCTALCAEKPDLLQLNRSLARSSDKRPSSIRKLMTL